ncbi:MAG TPA: hypothetical protein VHB99_07455 [Pirellulales bacterium]|nr:hypothetical protein [Pirellulales bacterium]
MQAARRSFYKKAELAITTADSGISERRLKNLAGRRAQPELPTWSFNIHFIDENSVVMNYACWCAKWRLEPPGGLDYAARDATPG